MASLGPGSDILCDQVRGFVSGSVGGAPMGTVNTGGRRSPTLHGFVIATLSGMPGHPTYVNRNRVVECCEQDNDSGYSLCPDRVGR